MNISWAFNPSNKQDPQINKMGGGGGGGGGYSYISYINNIGLFINFGGPGWLNELGSWIT